MKLPDGPRTPPYVQLIEWVARPLEFMETSAHRYGDTFTVRLSGFNPMVFFSNPQAIQEIFTAQPEQFDSGRGNDILLPWVGEHSLLLLDGEATSASDGC